MDIMDADTTDMDTMDIHTDTTMERDLLMLMMPPPLAQILMLKLIPTTMDTTDMDIGDTHTDMDTTTERGPLMLMKPQPQDQMQMLKLMLGMDTMAIDTMDIHTDTTTVRDLLMSLLLLVQTLMLMLMP